MTVRDAGTSLRHGLIQRVLRVAFPHPVDSRLRGNDGRLALPFWIAGQVRNDGVGVVGFLFMLGGFGCKLLA